VVLIIKKESNCSSCSFRKRVIPEYPAVPSHCPNCNECNTTRVMKARLDGKNETIGWICKKCFYYFIYPLKEVLKEEVKANG